MNEETKRKRKRTLIIFLALDGLLLLAFVLTCLPWAKRTSEPGISSALLNVNRIPDVASITLSKADEDGTRQEIRLFKTGSFWSGTDSSTGTTWPADNQNAAKFLEVCSQIITVKKAASDRNSWKAFGVDGKSSFTVSFNDPDGKAVSEIIFGESDYLNSRIAFRTGSQETVYFMDISIESYLNLSTSFWADPFVYPQALTGYSRLKAESALRHGALTSFARHEKADYTFKKNFENGAAARFLIYGDADDSDGSYTVVPEFIPGEHLEATEKETIKGYDYAYRMSRWTLEKFSEEVEQQ
ncbi:MAG: hypothetical protein II584_00855 [Treponema sp.]|nr:hypothetical protein [Treponema sp.]MBQ2600927.1 hypothetical protein [Treponema sp.]